MSRRQRVYGVTKCMQCHKAFLPDDEIRETVTSRWHAACLDQLEQWIAESRADYERQRQTDIEDLRAALTGGGASEHESTRGAS